MMDKKEPSSTSSDQSSIDETFTVLPTGKSCDKCGSTKDVQKFDGSYLCKGCRNQRASMTI